jgi:hypothetical protein
VLRSHRPQCVGPTHATLIYARRPQVPSVYYIALRPDEPLGFVTHLPPVIADESSLNCDRFVRVRYEIGVCRFSFRLIKHEPRKKGDILNIRSQPRDQLIQILHQRPLPLDFLPNILRHMRCQGHTFDPSGSVFGKLVQEALDMAAKDQ